MDVTVRRGSSYLDDGSGGGLSLADGGDGSTPLVSGRHPTDYQPIGGERGDGGGGCLAFLCGGGSGLTSVDAVDDVASEHASSLLRDDYQV